MGSLGFRKKGAVSQLQIVILPLSLSENLSAGVQKYRGDKFPKA